MTTTKAELIEAIRRLEKGVSSLTQSSGGVTKSAHQDTYIAFTDGLEAAAEICGSLAETKYDDSDGFEAATGCEAAIMAVVKQQRVDQRRANSGKETMENV